VAASVKSNFMLHQADGCSADGAADRAGNIPPSTGGPGDAADSASGGACREVVRRARP
jgi:hypothetical protein